MAIQEPPESARPACESADALRFTAVAFAAGLISCTLYRRNPNVFVLGAAHALISLTLFGALPFSVTHHLLVGPGYYSVAE